jgi:dihydrofolate synthase / folylpolyglutamate synthase
MKLQRAIQRLQKLHPKKIDLSLERSINLLKKLGNPQTKLKNIITVCGTNGKYSIIKSLQSILNQAGYKCNVYLSPHLQNYTERYVFEDKEINKNDLAELLEEIERVNGSDNLTIFEALTCAYFKYCEQFRDNISIIEAGLFHQYDATNVFKKNLCSIISSINMDHLHWLKNKSIEGIIHEKTTKLLNSKIFINKQENKDILLKIKNALTNNKSEKYFYGDTFSYSHIKNNLIQYKDLKGNLVLPQPNILGEHQLGNISTAIISARTLFNVSNESIKKGIVNINLKGRLQEIKTGKLKKLAKDNYLFLDGGHNLNAANSLAMWAKNSNKEIHLIVGMMKDKEHLNFISAFKDIIKSLTLIDIPNQDGSITKEEFKSKIKNYFPKVKTAKSINQAIIGNAKKSNNSYFLIAGSLYLAGEVLNLN